MSDGGAAEKKPLEFSHEDAARRSGGEKEKPVEENSGSLLPEKPVEENSGSLLPAVREASPSPGSDDPDAPHLPELLRATSSLSLTDQKEVVRQQVRASLQLSRSVSEPGLEAVAASVSQRVRAKLDERLQQQNATLHKLKQNLWNRDAEVQQLLLERRLGGRGRSEHDSSSSSDSSEVASRSSSPQPIFNQDSPLSHTASIRNDLDKDDDIDKNDVDKNDLDKGHDQGDQNLKRQQSSRSIDSEAEQLQWKRALKAARRLL